MRKNTSTNHLLAFITFTYCQSKIRVIVAFLMLAWSVPQVTFANTLFESAKDVSKQCNNVIERLTTTRFTEQKQKGTAFLMAFEQPIIFASNLKFKLLLAADVHQDVSIQRAAKVCLPKIQISLDRYFSTPSLKTILQNHLTNSAFSSDETVIAARYLDAINQANNANFIKKRQIENEKSRAFRSGISNETIKFYPLAIECASGLSKRKQNAWAQKGVLNIPSAVKSVNYAIARLDNEKCRQQLYTLHESRYRKPNETLLIDLIKAKNDSAHAVNKAYAADLAFNHTMLSGPAAVSQFLTAINPASITLSPWNNRFASRNAAKLTKNKISAGSKANKTVEKSLPPELVKQGLFKLLEHEFSLVVKPIKRQAWHQDVESYELYEIKASKLSLLGQFYFDLYPRAGKYKKNRHRAIQRGVIGVQNAEGALLLNLPRTAWQQKQIKSFFHEFGHLLHNLVAVQSFHLSSGISTERDLIEMPSKWFEWLSFNEQSQQMMFGQVIVNNVKADTGLKLKLRLYKAAIALAYHQIEPSHENFEQVNAKAFKHYVGYDYPKNSGAQYGFSHLATYGPRYYTYLWSEQMAKRLLDDYVDGAFSAKDFLSLYLKQGSRVSSRAMLAQLYQQPLSLDQIIQWLSDPQFNFNREP